MEVSSWENDSIEWRLCRTTPLAQYFGLKMSQSLSNGQSVVCWASRFEQRQASPIMRFSSFFQGLYLHVYQIKKLNSKYGSIDDKHPEERFLSLKTSPKKRSIYFVNNNPSMTSAWKRATATFSQIFFNVSAVVSIRSLPVHSHRHWKERMHFHIWGLRAWPFFEGKLPGMASLRTFQNPSTWPVWILTFPLFFRVLVRQKLPWLS